jgi:hypothetical protein
MKPACLSGVAYVCLAGALLGCGSSNNASPSADAGGVGGGDAGAGDGGSAFVPGAPITGLTQGTWKWIPIDGAICRNGSPTGIGVNVGSTSEKLMIFLEGGGACFNATTCAANASAFGESNFTSFSSAEGKSGIFDRTDSTNPVANWNYVYVPFCTGDIHGGNNVTGPNAGAGVASQHFVGYANVGLDLKRVVPTFPGLTQVLLTGVSAGGFGASANYTQVASAFGSVPVAMVDDSGPSMEDPYTPTCLQNLVKGLWGFDKTILADCGSACSNPATYYIDYGNEIGRRYPNAKLGLIESVDDSVITLFFGFGTNNGANDCKGTFSTPESAPSFKAGLIDMREKLKGNPNFGSYIFDAPDPTRHTSLITNFLGTSVQITDGVKLNDWVAQLLAGTVTNVGLGADDGGTVPDAAASDGGAAPDGGSVGDAAPDAH